jgi:hypothetical protein
MAETREEVLARIGQVRDASGDDFHLKIERRQSVSAFPVLIATIEGARVEHIATPESWLPKFVGGGMLQIKVFHATDRSKMVGMINDTFNSAPKEPDVSVLERPDWAGPRIAVYPPPKKAKENNSTTILVPPVDDGAVPRPLGGVDSGGPSHSASPMEAHLAQRAQALQHAENELAERKRQMEIDAIKKEAETKARAADERVKNLERQLDEIRNRPPPAPVVAPASSDKTTELLLELRKMDADQRRADRDAQQEQRRVERESIAEQKRQERETNLELARIRADADKASAQAQADMLKALASKPAIDPQIMELMGKNDTSKVMSDMAAVVSTSMSNQLNVMSALMDLGMGGREPAAPRIPKPSGWDSAAKILVPIITRAFAGPPAGTPPGQVINQPVNPAAKTPEALPAANGANGAQAPAPEAPPPVPPLASQIAELIKSKTKTPKEVAELILQNINDASIQTLAISSKGDPRVLFDMMLNDWLDDTTNRTYAAEILKVTLEQGIASGVFPDPDGAMLKDVPGVVKSFIDSESPA